MAYTRDQLRDLLTHHEPAEHQRLSHEKLLVGALNFAVLLIKVTPPGTAQSAALQKLRDCVGMANEALVGPVRPS